MSTAKTPGQVAFEKWWSTSSRPRQWEALNYFHQADWEGVAEAVIRMCAERLQQIGDKADARGDQEHSYYQSARFIEALIPAKNGGEG